MRIISLFILRHRGSRPSQSRAKRRLGKRPQRIASVRLRPLRCRASADRRATVYVQFINVGVNVARSSLFHRCRQFGRRRSIMGMPSIIARTQPSPGCVANWVEKKTKVLERRQCEWNCPVRPAHSSCRPDRAAAVPDTLKDIQTQAATGFANRSPPQRRVPAHRYKARRGHQQPGWMTRVGVRPLFHQLLKCATHQQDRWDQSTGCQKSVGCVPRGGSCPGKCSGRYVRPDNSHWFTSRLLFCATGTARSRTPLRAILVGWSNQVVHVGGP